MSEIVPFQEKFTSVAKMLEKARPALIQALPEAGLTPDRLLRVMLTTIRKNPKLLECTPASLIGCLLECAQLGLVPDGILGEAYINPYKTVATLIPGYKGYIALARRSGQVSTIHKVSVYEKDKFVFRWDAAAPDGFILQHTPHEGDDPGPLRAAYMLVKMKDGGFQAKVIYRRDAMLAKSRSAHSSGPWTTDEAAMWEKTAVRRGAPMLPLSAEDRTVIEREDRIEANLPPEDLGIPLEDAERILGSGEPAKASKLEQATETLKKRAPAAPKVVEQPKEPVQEAAAAPAEEEAAQDAPAETEGDDGAERQQLIEDLAVALTRIPRTKQDAIMGPYGVKGVDDIDGLTLGTLKEMVEAVKNAVASGTKA